MPETFAGVKPWPEGEAPDRHHNQPPLEAQILQEFEEAIARRGLDTRIREITDSAGRVPEISSDAACGKVGDLIRQARDVAKEVEHERETLNRPILTAQRSLKTKADALVAPMAVPIDALKGRLDAYMAAELVDAPVHGDLGARVGTKDEWRFEIINLAKVPKVIRQHPEVIEAIEKVIRAQVRGGARSIAGVRIWKEQKASVR